MRGIDPARPWSAHAFDVMAIYAVYQNTLSGGLVEKRTKCIVSVTLALLAVLASAVGCDQVIVEVVETEVLLTWTDAF